MNLFLDTISPIPKFYIINNNSIQSIQILNKNSNKISDNIVQVFLKMQRKFKLNDKIDNLIVCTGPGSYTAMRIGIAFMYGISITKKIPLIGPLFNFIYVSILREKIYSFFLKKNKKRNMKKFF